ncbi:Na+/H+ antiporter subunit A [Nakamurella aerolata]|uniref:Na+/H+ antiporter subunit A n=1 Tax=Nakamurella aerolata TaxID=1656892 RepID=A0A849A8V2_9ACTN|nr:Na+/H+ antiporter subunit A [Nakamurella aerolata]NNG36965.1 Na+/H+ antiporter subunit A [Nakamurella aerolata]
MVLALIALHFVAALLTPLLLSRLGARGFYVVALVPLLGMVYLLTLTGRVAAGERITESVNWIPALDVRISVSIGVLQWVLGMLVCGIGAVVLFYCRWYFGGDPPRRTGAVLVAFAGAMLGLVTSDDLMVMYVFWELTTVFSYLLVGHRPTKSANRSAAMTALIVTTAGGLAMLVGIVMLRVQTGSFSVSALLADPPSGTVTTVAVLLMVVGALTKSAQVPFHFWLPGAMAAPTPVSAYLHAAAMVKAGVYLVALLAPAFADTPGWRPILLGLGVLTMLLGGYRSLRQYDIKLLLAYGTVSQLGFLMVLVGMGSKAAALAGLAMTIAHALFKAALFMVVGIVDHNAGTRDLRALSGVGRQLPWVCAAAVVAGMSMAGLPPLLGFISKESAFVAATDFVGDHGSTPPAAAVLIVIGLLVGSALTFAYTLRFLWGAFADKSSDAVFLAKAVPPATTCRPVHRGFVAAPLLLAALSLIGGFAGGPLTKLLTPYVESFRFGEEPESLALWHGFTVPLGLSVLAWIGGATLFARRDRVARVQATFPRVWDAELVYHRVMRGVDRAAVETTGRTQRGSLPVYLGSILLVVVLVPGSAMLMAPSWPAVRWFDTPTQLVVGAVIVLAAFLTATSRGRLKAVLLLGVTGYGVAFLFLLHGAPDLALTQALVETVTLIVFVLVLRTLPKYFTRRPLRSNRWWRLAIAVAVAVVACGIAVLSAGARVSEPISQAYSRFAYEFGYGKNIVNVILVDARAWDTIGEVSVLVVAATGVASLIFLNRRYSNDVAPTNRGHRHERAVAVASGRRQLVWLRGGQSLSPSSRSIVFEVMTRLLFPTMILVSLFFLFSGHNRPGGGFAGGLVAGLALMIRYLAGGRNELDDAAPVEAGKVLGAGLVVACVSALAPIAFGGRVLQSYAFEPDLGLLGTARLPWGDLALLGDPKFVTSLFFDIGVYLIVIGVMLDIARSLGSAIDRQAEQSLTPRPLDPSTATAAMADATQGRDT